MQNVKKCKCKCDLFTHEAPKSLRARFSVSVRSRSNWNLEVLGFWGEGKPEYPEKNLSEQGREPTTNSTHISTPGFEPGPHWWEASALTTAPPLLPCARFEFRFETLKSISVSILFVYKLMIGSSENNRENYPKKCF